MYNDLFTIGPFTAHTYGLFYVIGIISAFFVTEKRGKKLGIDISHLEPMAIFFVITGFIGAKLLYCITRFQEVLQDPAILFDLVSGWVVYGGILGGLLGAYLYCKKYHLNFLEQVDLIIPSVALAQGFGRLGCFFAGCCYGVETHLPIGLVFPEGSLAPAGIPLFPTQLISSAFDFLLFFVLIWLVKEKKNTFHGEVGLWYLFAYSIGRFIIEYFRGDLVRGEIGSFSTSQIISLLLFASALILWFILKKREKRD
ncbi:prolipoprotein diacylglyceryl transferase [Dubosiella newyorkensis]|uniref:prolipoprotein diacylglyceryl transferase n=1 Tax=Dubosiella newyorkensis TaxID=1862672 RepID=UPI0023F44D1C|nr:prolipoprotein diacylglyceryl transferase [Dubosiella newyorkensis]